MLVHEPSQYEAADYQTRGQLIHVFGWCVTVVLARTHPVHRFQPIQRLTKPFFMQPTLACSRVAGVHKGSVATVIYSLDHLFPIQSVLFAHSLIKQLVRALAFEFLYICFDIVPKRRVNPRKFLGMRFNLFAQLTR